MRKAIQNKNKNLDLRVHFYGWMMDHKGSETKRVKGMTRLVTGTGQKMSNKRAEHKQFTEFNFYLLTGFGVVIRDYFGSVDRIYHSALGTFCRSEH